MIGKIGAKIQIGAIPTSVYEHWKVEEPLLITKLELKSMPTNKDDLDDFIDFDNFDDFDNSYDIADHLSSKYFFGLFFAITPIV